MTPANLENASSAILKVETVKYAGWREEVRPDRHIFGNVYGGQEKYVVWGDKKSLKNQYPSTVIALYESNPLLKAVTDRNKSAIQGNELIFSDENPSPITLMPPKDYFKLIGVDSNLIEAIAFDIALWNGAALQAAKPLDKDAKLGKVVTRVDHIKFYKIRIGVPNEFGDVDRYYISPDWANVINTDSPNVTEIQSYGIQGEAASPLQLMYETMYCPISDYYPFPDCESCQRSLWILNKIVEYQGNYISNGMVGSGMLYMPYIPINTAPEQPLSSEDAQAIARIKEDITNSLNGVNNAGKLTIIFYNPMAKDGNGDPVGIPKIDKALEDKNDAKFIEMLQESTQLALTGLNVISRELFGIPSSGGFSSQANMLLTANEIHYNTVIVPKQKILTRMLDRLLADAGYTARVSIANSLPVAYNISIDEVAAGVFTIDEYREQKGFAPRKQTESIKT